MKSISYTLRLLFVNMRSEKFSNHHQHPSNFLVCDFSTKDKRGNVPNLLELCVIYEHNVPNQHILKSWPLCQANTPYIYVCSPVSTGSIPAVYRGQKKAVKLKFQNERQARTGLSMVKSSSPNGPST
jgi:hypothetical protein